MQAPEPTFKKVSKKYIRTVEIPAGEQFIIPRNQRIVVTKVIHEIVSDAKEPTFPKYKTIIVLECVEFEEVERPKLDL